MIIRSENKYLTFEIDDYQFPNYKSNGEGYDYDANWLIVKITYSDDNRTEEYRDPCLLTYELEEMIDGFLEVITGKEALFISDFMEPYLKFIAERVNDAILIGIEFVYDTTDGIWKKWGLSEVIDQERSKQLVNEMRSTSSFFPQR